MKRDLSNIDSIQKIYELEDGDHYTCFMCLERIVRGTFIVTLKKKKNDKKSKDGIETCICDNCLSIIMSQKIHDHCIDASTIDYYEDTYDEMFEIRENFISCIEDESEVTIKGKEYIILSKDRFDDFIENLNEICYMNDHIKTINKIRSNENKPKEIENE